MNEKRKKDEEDSTTTALESNRLFCRYIIAKIKIHKISVLAHKK